MISLLRPGPAGPAPVLRGAGIGPHPHDERKVAASTPGRRQRGESGGFAVERV